MIEYENLHKLNAPFLNAYRQAFDRVLDSGWFILGNQVKEFERAFASYCGCAHAIGVGNGLDALTLALRSFDFKPGDEVLVPSNTYVATILSVLQCGLKPVLVEPDLTTYNMDPARMEEARTARTVAVMVVHLYGKCAAMDEITSFVSRHNLKLIEDSAQAHGATFKGKKAGTFGDFGAFSFYPTKNLGALGDGGCLTTDHEALRKTASFLRNYGSDRKYYNELIGVNSRLDEIQAAFLSIKLKSLDDINAHKRKLAAIYQNGLKADFVRPVVHPDYVDVYHIYNVRHPERDRLKTYLEEHGIKTEIHYPVAPHRQKALQPYFPGKDFPIASLIHQTTLSLPISYFHTEDDVRQVIEVMNRF
jgi:dTDP-4-amino-4,6-dideoxygalactose transaminase